MNLEEFFTVNSNVAIAFSGGVDSAYLLYAAVKYAVKVKAYYVRTPFQPEFEYEDALLIAGYVGANLQTIEIDILNNREIAANPVNRCYFCKHQIFESIYAAARKDGFDILLDGTNSSDEVSDRPGMKALEELKVLSPLRMCNLTKKQIRDLSKEAGLFTWNKPAYACLATRIPTGTAITSEILEKTERSEEYLKSIGFEDFRIRYFNGAAKIQIKDSQFSLLLEHKQEITDRLKRDYVSVLLDLECRGTTC